MGEGSEWVPGVFRHATLTMAKLDAFNLTLLNLLFY